MRHVGTLFFVIFSYKPNVYLCVFIKIIYICHYVNELKKNREMSTFFFVLPA